jgi:hypothetical protein
VAFHVEVKDRTDAKTKQDLVQGMEGGHNREIMDSTTLNTIQKWKGKKASVGKTLKSIIVWKL